MSREERKSRPVTAPKTSFDEIIERRRNVRPELIVQATRRNVRRALAQELAELEQERSANK